MCARAWDERFVPCTVKFKRTFNNDKYTNEEDIKDIGVYGLEFTQDNNIQTFNKVSSHFSRETVSCSWPYWRHSRTPSRTCWTHIPGKHTSAAFSEAFWEIPGRNCQQGSLLQCADSMYVSWGKYKKNSLKECVTYMHQWKKVYIVSICPRDHCLHLAQLRRFTGIARPSTVISTHSSLYKFNCFLWRLRAISYLEKWRTSLQGEP